MDWLHVVAGAFVGLMVGLTGVGGGSLMAPILILLFGVSPTTAVGTDLWFASLTKAVGGVVHHRHGGETGGPDYRVVKYLCYGSIPAALIVLFILSRYELERLESSQLTGVIGFVLILAAIATLFRGKFHQWASAHDPAKITRLMLYQPMLTIGAGLILGVMVTLTSVGAGAIGATLLLMIYPIQMRLQRLVATDIVHAIPLTLVAGLGHLWIGNVNAMLLINLLIGSIPGVIVGSLLSAKAPERLLQLLLAIILVIVGVRMMM